MPIISIVYLSTNGQQSNTNQTNQSDNISNRSPCPCKTSERVQFSERTRPNLGHIRCDGGNLLIPPS